MWHPEFAVVAGLGVIASAYAALAVSRSAVNQDRKNADRYLSAEDQLKERRLDLDTYRKGFYLLTIQHTNIETTKKIVIR